MSVSLSNHLPHLENSLPRDKNTKGTNFSILSQQLLVDKSKKTKQKISHKDIRVRFLYHSYIKGYILEKTSSF
jgi:hypothetical protein